MSTHLMPFVRVALVLAFALASMPLLRKASAAARRVVLSSTFVFALAVPFIPTWRVDAPTLEPLLGRLVAEPSTTGSFAQTAAVRASSSVDVLAIVYVVGASLVFLRFAVGLVLADRTARRAVPIRSHRRVEVRMSSEIDVPAVTGTLAPVILVPTSSKTWSESRWDSVLRHELAHIGAFDLVFQGLAFVTCSLHWFNPLAWIALRRLRLERELAADEAVLRAGTKASAYAADLLAIARTARGHSGMIAISEHPMTKRISAIVAVRRPTRLHAKGAIGLVAAAAAASFAAACSTSAQTPAPHTATRSNARDLQAIADSELDRAVKEWNAAGGTILVLSPKGEVLADAGGRSDRAYVSGSTFKTILLAAAIDEGVVKESDVFDCDNGQRGAKQLHDVQPRGSLALGDMLAVSSNVGFAQLFDRLGGTRADRVFRRFHFSPPPAFASQGAGDWDGALTAIGVTTTTTPLELASAYAAIANGGDGIVKASTAERVSALLENAVASEKSTSKNARVSGVRVAGKTGTSEWTSKTGLETHYASFVGYVPADRPRYVVFVGIENAKGDNTWGGDVAAPVFSRVAVRALAR